MLRRVKSRSRFARAGRRVPGPAGTLALAILATCAPPCRAEFPLVENPVFPSSPILSESCVKDSTRDCADPACHPQADAGRDILHPAYLERRCKGCHVAPRSLWAPLVRAWPDAVCLRCHADVQWNPRARAVAHPPGGRSCVACHNPHRSRVRNLLRSEARLADCAGCHASFLEQSQASPYRHDHFDLHTECGFCHYAHRPGLGKYVRENGRESCLTCHDMAIPHRGRVLENVARRLKEAPVTHGSPEELSCPVCHTPHGSPQPALLKEGYPAGSHERYSSEQYAMCFRCHPPGLAENAVGSGITEFRAGAVNLHHLHLVGIGKGRACHVCHEAHASDLPHLLRRQVRFGRWDAPLGYESLPNGGRCATPCHPIREYSRSPAPAAGTEASDVRGEGAFLTGAVR